MIAGWYYLHTNGSLIYKPRADAIADLRESDFCRCAWPVKPDDRETAWVIAIESLALGADPARVSELAEKWGLTDEDADIYAERVNVRLFRSGDKWTAVGPHFIDRLTSPAGYGTTKLEAMAALGKALGLMGGVMWRRSFKDTVSLMA